MPEWPAAWDLFAFDGPSRSGPCEVRIQEIVPLVPVGPEDVLRLAAQAAWPAEHPVSQALAAAVRERFGPGGVPERAGIWHLSPGRGIQGYHNGFHVLIGNEQLMRDGGIPLTGEIRDRIARHSARGWHSLLIGARAAAADREDVHRSLIGLLALAPGRGGRESPSVPVSRRTRDPEASRPQPRPRRRPSWWAGAITGLACALVGLYLSALTGRPDEAALIHRLRSAADTALSTEGSGQTDVEGASTGNRGGKGSENPLSRADQADARLQLIRDLMTDPLPGRRVERVAPALGPGCRISLWNGRGIQVVSHWTWPMSQPARPGELNMLTGAIEGYRASMDEETTLVPEAGHEFFRLLEREPSASTRPAD